MLVITYHNDYFDSNTLHFMWRWYDVSSLQHAVISLLYHPNTVERIEL